MNIYESIRLKSLAILLENAADVKQAAEHISQVDVTNIGYGIWLLLGFYSASGEWSWSFVSSALKGCPSVTAKELRG